MSLSPSERTRLRESIALEQQLLVLAGPGVRPLLNRLSELTGEAASDATDHALRICGGILLEHGHEQLFEEIYARTLELESVKPGELRRFLFGEIAA